MMVNNWELLVAFKWFRCWKKMMFQRNDLFKNKYRLACKILQTHHSKAPPPRGNKTKFCILDVGCGIDGPMCNIVWVPCYWTYARSLSSGTWQWTLSGRWNHEALICFHIGWLYGNAIWFQDLWCCLCHWSNASCTHLSGCISWNLTSFKAGVHLCLLRILNDWSLHSWEWVSWNNKKPDLNRVMA